MAALDALLSGSLAATPTHAAELDGLGLDGLYTYEGNSDVFFPLVLAASHTGGLLYTNVAVALPRSPLHLAHQAWDLQRLTGGRFALGLGSQIRAHIERRYGATWDRPRAQMTEIIAAIRAIFAAWQHGTPLDFRGRWTQHTLMPPTLTPPPLEHPPPPIWAAALGPRMTQMAGDVADGLLVHPFTSREHLVRQTMPNLAIGLDASGRARTEMTVTVGAIVGLHDEDESQEQVTAAVRATLGFYGSTPAYRSVLDLHGWGELQPALRELTASGRWNELAGLVDDDHLAALAYVGTPTQVATALHERLDDVADRVALSLPRLARPDLLGQLVDAYRDTAADAS